MSIYSWILCGCQSCDCQYVYNDDCDDCSHLAHYAKGNEIHWLKVKIGA